MKSIYRFGTLLGACWLLTIQAGNAQNLNDGSAAGALSLENTEVLTISSEILQRDYELWISLPRSYSSGNQRFPVIIQTDAYRSFITTKGMIDVFTFPYTFIPESILVGIGYGGRGTNASRQWAEGRTRDLTPVEDTAYERAFAETIRGMGFQIDEIETGGASGFLAFIKNELLPYLDTHYRTDPGHRMFSGYSFGGLFGCYVLFHDPELFDMYLLGSPSLHYGNEITFHYEEAYAAANEDLNARVFMSFGKSEEFSIPYLERMENTLSSRGFDHLSLHTVIFEGESHVSCYPAALSRGLLTLFQEERPDSLSESSSPSRQ